MWSRSHPPTPGQQPSFICYWDPESADRAIRRKFGHTFAEQSESVPPIDNTLYSIDESTEKSSKKLSGLTLESQVYADNNGRDFKSGTLFATNEEGRSDNSSPGSQKASDESSLSGPSWRMRRGLGEFRDSENDVNSSRDGETSASKDMDIGANDSTNADKLDRNYNEASRPPISTSTTKHLLGVKHLKVKHEEPDLCHEQITPLHGRRCGQAFAQTKVQDDKSNYFTSLTGYETERTDYFGDVDLAPLPSKSRITSNASPERPSIKYRGSESADGSNSIDFKTNMFDGDSPVVVRPKYRHRASNSLLQKLRREARSEEIETFLEGHDPALRASNFSTITDTTSSGFPKRKRFFKPQIFRAPASAPIVKSRRTETAAASDLTRDDIGRNRKTLRRAIRSSEGSDASVNPINDVTSGSPPITKEGILRKYWTLGLRNPLLFPIYLGTSKRSRLFGNSSLSLSTDDRDFHDSSESQSMSELATPDSEHLLAPGANDTNDYFRVRSNRLEIDDDENVDEERGKLHVDIPDHLPSSPLCPLHPKYRGVYLAECPQHGKRHVGLSVLNL